MDTSTVWRCLAMIGSKDIRWMVLWRSGILLITLPCIMGIWGPYMDSDLLIFSLVIGQFLI